MIESFACKPSCKELIFVFASARNKMLNTIEPVLIGSGGRIQLLKCFDFGSDNLLLGKPEIAVADAVLGDSHPDFSGSRNGKDKTWTITRSANVIQALAKSG